MNFDRFQERDETNDVNEDMTVFRVVCEKTGVAVSEHVTVEDAKESVKEFIEEGKYFNIDKVETTYNLDELEPEIVSCVSMDGDVVEFDDYN